MIFITVIDQPGFFFLVNLTLLKSGTPGFFVQNDSQCSETNENRIIRFFFYFEKFYESKKILHSNVQVVQRKLYPILLRFLTIFRYKNPLQSLQNAVECRIKLRHMYEESKQSQCHKFSRPFLIYCEDMAV